MTHSMLFCSRRDIKMIFIGNTMVGKSCIIAKYMNGKFKDTIEPTVGASFFSREFSVHGQPIILNVWDTAGQEAYRYLVPMYYRNADIAIIVFDLTKHDSFENINYWIGDVRKNCGKDVSIYLCANKCDLEKERTVSAEEIQYVERLQNISCCETSALTGQGIEKLFAFAINNYLEHNPQCFSLDPSPPPFERKRTKCCY